ncbi:uncharacterized protein LOC130511537 [Raphanus sativus]|uniref:Uncharacterized protein LOC130511537 n=1 Tax=Raphanus sativus TaxID=3726 RepID=A0A9W3DL56_RAPSA|nr:uncharacterized protein LOC130511537 [Raphanus sativus]
MEPENCRPKRVKPYSKALPSLIKGTSLLGFHHKRDNKRSPARLEPRRRLPSSTTSRRRRSPPPARQPPIVPLAARAVDPEPPVVASLIPSLVTFSDLNLKVRLGGSRSRSPYGASCFSSSFTFRTISI